jgi:hypothetical protein
MKDLAATYSRGSYTSTTIGKAAFDGRVRDGIGSDHSFMATKKVTTFEDSISVFTTEGTEFTEGKREQEFFLSPCPLWSLWLIFGC